jgi:hypothetical protein
MSELKRRLGGRPWKRRQELLAPYAVINRDNNALIYTDAELLFAINEKPRSTGFLSRLRWSRVRCIR